MKKVNFFTLVALAILGLLSYNPAKAGNIYVNTTTGSDANTGYGETSARSTITKAITDAVSGDNILVGPGTYIENLTINKKINLAGAGQDAGGTILKATVNSPVITLTTGGNSVNDLMCLSDFKIEADGKYAINIGSGSVGYLRFENLLISGKNNQAYTENEVGLKVSSAATLYNLMIMNCTFQDLDYGWYFAKTVGAADLSTVDNITVINSKFLRNDAKAIYVEKLNNTTFDNCLVENNGSDNFWNSAWNGGFDINLKNGNYQNITIKNSTFINNGLTFKEGAALMIKARNDGATYSAWPATLDNILIEGCVITGNERGIRLGEPTKNNPGPTNVIIRNSEIAGNNKTYAGSDGSAYGDLINQSTASVQAKNNWWGTTQSTEITNKTYGLIEFTPYLLTPIGRMNFDLAFNKAPRITDERIELDFKINKNCDNLSGLQFDLTVPKLLANLNDLTITHLSQAGVAITNQIAVSKNIIATGDISVTYRVVIIPQNNDNTKFLHNLIANSPTDLYAVLRISLKKSSTLQSFKVGDLIAIRMNNIVASQPSGGKVVVKLFGTEVQEASFNYIFKATGDINNDGLIDILDVMRQINHILGQNVMTYPSAEFQEADLNRDGVIDIADVTVMINLINGITIF